MSMSDNEILWANDLDRNLLDTNAAFDCFINTCVNEGVVRHDELMDAKRETELSGGSFNLTAYLEQEGVDAGTLQELYDAFSAFAPKERLLYPDARKFLSRLALDDAPAMVLTYGDPAWQLAKIRASGLGSSNYLITSSKYKGELIAGWQGGDGYEVDCDNDAVLRGRTVHLTDDKADSFRGLPEECRGFLVCRGTVRLASQAGVVPGNVQTVDDMTRIPFADPL